MIATGAVNDRRTTTRGRPGGTAGATVGGTVTP